MRRAAGQLRGAIGPSAVVASSLGLVGGCVPEGPPTGDRAPAEPTSTAVAAASVAREGPPLPSPSAPLDGPFRDDFDRDELGRDWHALSDAWRLSAGELCGRGAKNRGIWLRRRLPANARIEIDARSGTDEGDIKLELWGDGRSGSRKASYDDATGYIAIFGGWSNSRHVLARLDEHGADRRVTEVRADGGVATGPVVAGRTYHFRIERRDGSTLRWWVDDVLMHTFPDPSPLSGPGHDHIGLNDWVAPVCFDNLEVTPL